MNFGDLAPKVSAIVEEAGRLAAKQFRYGEQTTSKIWYKNGHSPVTETDIATNNFLQARLTQLLPDAGWLSEETADDNQRLTRELVWVVDPIDGTRAFLSGHPDWCISVALLANGQPVLGNVFAPVHDKHYWAAEHQNAYCNDQIIHVSPHAALKESRISGPKFMVGEVSEVAGQLISVPRIPSLALRIARVAEGEIDVGLVSDNSHDWDIAAADIILREAGGIMTSIKGEVIRYNNSDTTHEELAASSKLLHSSLIRIFD
ncbi:3'(2'),5'-bisphosphate nucleotidase CysQ [Microvirga sp. W0021]|uniref:3'(2'),5'-bisphosphate nucleotidase CysQ n=1 Tax=Hohaiivirga grylli TaxID=3133970 RepID=A0ABV0BHG2_9HYPH